MKVLDREVVLKALVGSHNYNLANEESDKDYKVFTPPTFEELYNGKRYSNQIIGEKEDLDMHDIRKLTDLFFKSNINFLEVLASSEIIIPEGNPEIHEIYALKKEIFKMNLPHLFDACKGMYYNKMKAIHKGTEGTQHLVDAYGFDTKQGLHSHRVTRFCVDFEATDFNDFEGAMRYFGEDLQFMLDIRHGEFNYDTFEKFNTHYFESTFLHLGKKYHEQPVNLELKAELESIVMRLVKRKLN